MLNVKDMTLEELAAIIKADFERFCDGCDEDTSAEVLSVLDEIARRSEPCTPPPFNALTDVKNMTDEELTQIWESALYAPIDAEIPEIVIKALHELVDREDAYLESLEREVDPQ